MIALERLGHLDQVALATDRPAIDVHVYRGIDLRIHPDRGLDIGAAWFQGFPLAWIAGAGEGGADGDEWRSAWGGGLVTTCGLDNVGAPSEGLGLHGTYTFLRASGVEVRRTEREVTCTGTIEDPRGLQVERTITTQVGEGRVELVDRVRNVSSEVLEALVLYHVNLGWPLWDQGALVETNAEDVRPRDGDAAPFSPAQAPPVEAVPERVWEHVGATWARISNGALGLGVIVSSNLPRLWQWVDPAPGVYALALEPANCSVLGRAHGRREGTLPVLEPGAERTTRISIAAETA
jgi:Domain of unknown function (DUF4432)